jgi:glycosyltransferase involved in cell wall biosynthesis
LTLNNLNSTKSLWIINQYIGTPALGIDGHRHYYFAQKFKEKGYNLSLITSSFSHVPRKDYSSDKQYDIVEESYGNLGVIQTPKYGSARGMGRIWSMLVFMLKLFFFPFDKLPKPDVVIVSSISLLPILNGFLLRRKYGCKLILEIRDIWPLTLIELGGFGKYNPFVMFLALVERAGYKHYDFVTSLLPRTIDHIEETLGRKVNNFAHIPNGIFLEEKKNSVPLNAHTLSQIPKDKFIVGYAGSLGVANAMEPVIEAFGRLTDKNIYLCIVGEGYLKADLKKAAVNDPNIIFIDPIPKTEVESLLQNFDVLCLSWQETSLYRFGVSANKIFDYMYAAKPLLMAGKIADNIVELADCGLTTPPSDVAAIKNAVTELKDKSKEELSQMGTRGKQYVLAHNTIDGLCDKYIEIFKSL